MLRIIDNINMNDNIFLPFSFITDEYEFNVKKVRRHYY